VVASAENEELSKVNTEINYAQDLNAEWAFSKPSVGSMPKARLECATSTLVLDALGLPYEPGVIVPITFTAKGITYTENFTLSGYWEGDSVAMAQQFLISKELCMEVAPTPERVVDATDITDYCGYWMMDFNFSNSFDIEGKVIDLLERNGYEADQIFYGVNWAYATSYADPATMGMLVLILSLILLSGYLIIYNVFFINVSGDIRSYGLLKTIGTTGKQLRKIVLRQAMVLSLFGIPMGLILGTLLGRVLVPSILGMLNLSGVEEISMNPAIYIGSSLFTLITVYLSCRKPSRLASKVSPVEAIRYTDKGLSSKKREKKTGKITTFSMAKSNLGRNKKKVMVVVLSLSLSLILLNSTFSITKGLDMDKYVANSIIGDFIIKDKSMGNNYGDIAYDGVTRQNILDLSNLNGIKNVGIIYSSELVKTVNEVETAYYNKIFEKFKKTFVKYGEYEKNTILKEKKMDYNLYALNDICTAQLSLIKGKIDLEKFNSGNYVIVNTYSDLMSEEDTLFAEDLFCDIGDRITITLPDGTDKEYEVMALAEIPYALSKQVYNLINLDIILPETEYLAHTSESEQGAMLLELNVNDVSVDQVENYLENYSTKAYGNLDYVSKNSYKESFEGFKNMFLLVGGALCVILALIGILNFMNSSITSIMARKQEFAMMESVGMTGKQLKSMLIWEGMFYAIFTILASIVLGTVVGYFVIQVIAGSIWFFTWHFTLVPILLCMPVIGIVAYLIPVAAYHNLCRESIVERLRLTE
ncbi:MAG: ABC transporter permease, partial [Mobilitalea sp.]